MVSRLLGKLESRIAKARDPVEAACLRAERASMLARQGQLDSARAELAALHARHDRNPHVAVSAWVSLAEGMVYYFSDLNASARDKMRRALALSTAAQLKPLRALSAAWLAHMDFGHHDFQSMVRNIALSLQTAEANHHSARSRATLVTAYAYHMAEKFDMAMPWYSLAHQHASAEGDSALLGALMHNMAILHAVRARRMSFEGEVSPEQIRQAEMGTASITHFDRLIGAVSLTSLLPMQAQVLMLSARYAEARAIFDEHLQLVGSGGLVRTQSIILADTAWCRFQTGDSDGALRDARAAQARIGADTQVDDRAMTHSRLAQIHTALGNADAARHFTALAQADWQVYSARQAELVLALNETLSPPPSDAGLPLPG